MNQQQQQEQEQQNGENNSKTDAVFEKRGSDLQVGNGQFQQDSQQQQQFQENQRDQQFQGRLTPSKGSQIQQNNEFFTKESEQNFQDEETFNNNLGNQGGFNDKSLWLAKKAHHDTEKNISLLMNRLALLKKEEERSQKKIQDVRTKTKKILESKKRNEDMNQRKNQNRQHDDEFLNLMQKKSHELRKQQEEERMAIREAIQEQKREEYFEIKKQQQENERKIRLAKQKQHETKKQKHDRVNSIVESSRKNIETYWQHRLKFFEDQQEQERYENLKLKENKEKLLEKLEEQEAQIIKRLQYSQEVHEKACRELDQVIQMPASHYLQKSQTGSMPSLAKNNKYE